MQSSAYPQVWAYNPKEENRVTVAKSISVEKHSIKLATLITALYYDLAQDKLIQIPKQNERRDRELQELLKKGKRPVALFIDEAHDLNGHTLIGLKRLMGNWRKMSAAGCRPSWRAIPNCATTCAGRRWKKLATAPTSSRSTASPEASATTFIGLLGVSTGNTVESESILSSDAIDILATKLRTPLQVQLHLTLALEAGYQTGEKPVTAELVETVMSRQLDDLEPTLARRGYRLKDMVEQFDAKASEIRSLFSNQLEPKRTAEIRERMLAAGLPAFIQGSLGLAPCLAGAAARSVAVIAGSCRSNAGRRG
jgi:hypothetical protein